MWTVRASDEFAVWFRGLTAAEREAIDVKVGLLKLAGPKLARPHADTLNGSRYANMKELRADTADAVFRIAFAFDPNRDSILLGTRPASTRNDSTSSL